MRLAHPPSNRCTPYVGRFVVGRNSILAISAAKNGAPYNGKANTLKNDQGFWK